jgi:hypothetical protein
MLRVSELECGVDTSPHAFSNLVCRRGMPITTLHCTKDSFTPLVSIGPRMVVSFCPTDSGRTPVVSG